MMPIISWQFQLSRTNNCCPPPSTHNKLKAGKGSGSIGARAGYAKQPTWPNAKCVFTFVRLSNDCVEGIGRLLSATRRHGQLQYDQRQQIADNNSDNNNSSRGSSGSNNDNTRTTTTCRKQMHDAHIETENCSRSREAARTERGVGRGRAGQEDRSCARELWSNTWRVFRCMWSWRWSWSWMWMWMWSRHWSEVKWKWKQSLTNRG